MSRRIQYCPAMALQTSQPDVVIRSASSGEAQAVLDLMHSAFASHRGRLVPESSVFRETADAIGRQLERGGGFVAATGMTLAGCVIAEGRDDHGYLGRLAVDSAFRRRGIARLLIAAAEDYVRNRGLDRIALNVRIALPDNIALFHRLGYRETARLAHPGFAQPTYLVMEKLLS